LFLNYAVAVNKGGVTSLRAVAFAPQATLCSVLPIARVNWFKSRLRYAAFVVNIG